MMTVAIHSKPVAQDLSQVYEEVFPAVASFVSKMGGSLEDAKDIFHDALVVVVEKDVQVDNIAGYIVGIAKHLWLRKHRDNKHRAVLPDLEDDERIPIPARLFRLVEAAGKTCLDLLQSFYYEKRPADSVASEFNYSSAHSAIVQKHKCLQKLRAFVKEKSLDYESFVE